jgi:hypothetical protein
MNHSSITISWEKNSDGSTDISVSGEINSVPYFKEAFLTLDTPPFIYGVTERETNAENAGNSATIALLNILTNVIRKSDKTEGRIISENEQNKRFQLLDITTIRKFAILAGIKIDETKFRNLSEFRQYIQRLIDTK